MMKTHATTVEIPPEFDAKYWWIQVILGMGFIAMSLWFYTSPFTTYISLAVFFSYAMFISGIFEVVNGLALQKKYKHWNLLCMGGCIDILIGGFLIANENVSVTIMPLFLGIWFLFRGIAFVLNYIKVREHINEHKVWLLISVVFTFIMGILVLSYPVIGELTLVYTVSLAFFFIGLFRVSLGIQLRKALRRKDE